MAFYFSVCGNVWLDFLALISLVISNLDDRGCTKRGSATWNIWLDVNL